MDFTEHCSSPPEFASPVNLLPAHTSFAAQYQSLSFPVSLLYHMPFLRTASSSPTTHPASTPASAFIAALLIICLGNHNPRTMSEQRQRSRFIRHKTANTIARGFLISGQNCHSVGILHPSQIWSMMQRCLPPCLLSLQSSTQ